MRAAELMQKDLISVSPELSVAKFEELLTAEDIGGAPVIGTDGRVVGIASKTDIVRALSDEKSDRLRDLLDPQLTVEDIMTRELVTVAPDADVREVARRMIDGRLHRVLVVEADEVVGIVTSLDLLQLLTR